MNRLTHGALVTVNTEEEINALRAINPTFRFGFMFPDLQCDDDNLLMPLPATANNLRRLGATMVDPGVVIPGVKVPAIHTFFGQFVDHDVTLERATRNIDLSNPTPLSPEEIASTIVNSRSPNLDLDHVYGPDIDGNFPPRDPCNPEKLLLGPVAKGKKGLPFGKDIWNDFPRLEGKSPLVGDSRDDENVIVHQLHVAFIRAHNALVDRRRRFDEARKLLVQHYQWIVLNEFLEQIADPDIVITVRTGGRKFFNPPAETFFMPLEYSVAAFRFGHSKVRPSYDAFNNVQFEGGLDLLFRPGRTLPEHWIISWPSFLDPENKDRFPRPIDTSLSQQLTELPPDVLDGQAPERNLAIRNLLRGYILRLPTGQAVAKAMAIQPMTEQQIISVANRFPRQTRVLSESGFLARTPLWFYILAEAAFFNGGRYLGPVGSTIVAEVLISVLSKSTDSILSNPHWRPSLGRKPSQFDFKDLLKLAGVFS